MSDEEDYDDPGDLALVMQSLKLQHEALKHLPVFAKQLHADLPAGQRDKALYLAGVVAAHSMLTGYGPLTVIPLPTMPEMSE